MRLQNYLNEVMTKKQLSMIAGISDRQDKKATKFKKGQSVTHYKFGKGKVVGIDKNTYSIIMLTVQFGKDKIARPSHEFEEGQ
jgi:hypothetical protein